MIREGSDGSMYSRLGPVKFVLLSHISTTNIRVKCLICCKMKNLVEADVSFIYHRVNLLT